MLDGFQVVAQFFTADAEILDSTLQVRGDIFIGYRDGSPQVTPFTSTSVKNSFANNLQGASVGISAVRFFSAQP